MREIFWRYKLENGLRAVNINGLKDTQTESSPLVVDFVKAITNPWHYNEQEMPKGHEADSKKEAEHSSKVGNQGVEAVDGGLTCHLH